jgi:hypothetical protein
MGQTKKPIKRQRITYHTVEWEGEKHRLAKISKGRNVSKENKIKISKLVCLMYETDLHSLEDCTNKVGVSIRTFYKWREDVAEIAELYLGADKKKENIYRHKLRDRARTMAERLMDGYTVELTDREAEPMTDKHGNITMRQTKVKKREQFIRPSVKLVETVLYNTDARVFEKNPKPIEKINREIDIPLIDWVD